ncbi:SpoIIE family protein phosphatase [Castellaniella sp.]|uniref:SpoIIE family protein phosphatase n=1 Tax=Castellaniella sp. TaxID=1955812 RepID=UPI0035673760
MRPRSLRSKIFLLVGLTTLLGAIAVMLITQQNVTRTVVASEKHAVHNVLDLILHDSEARWGALLTDKITTVRNSRSQLLQLGATLHSVLALHAEQAAQGVIDLTSAQDQALAWISALDLGDERFGFIFDDTLTILASGRADWMGTDLSSLKDYKGRALATSMHDEARITGHGFAIYRWPVNNTSGGDGDLMYAYFGYFEPWNWVIAITGNARQIARQFNARRQEMEQSVRAALAPLKLAQSGFAFIIDDAGILVSPPPAGHDALLDAHGAHGLETLRQQVMQRRKPGQIQNFLFDEAGRDHPWQISTAYFKPLGWTIVAAVPNDDLTAPAQALRNRLGLVFALVLLVSLVVAWLWSARISRPLRRLSDFARALPEQDLQAAGRIPPYIARLPRSQPDEVGRLAATFIYMDQQLREKITRLIHETSRRERFESELSIARNIQTGLLPQSPEAGISKKIDLYATMLPAREVGGDLYDYFELPDGRLCLAIGDVSDKGIPAALFMAVTRTLIRASAEDESNPARLLERVNNRLAEHNPNMMFVTLILCVLDCNTGELAWANAGHPPPCIVSAAGALRVLEGRSGPACGVQENLSYQAFDTTLAQGEYVFGYTDGVTEAWAPDHRLYGEARLYDVLAGASPDEARCVVEAVLDDLAAFTQGLEQSDDITVIVAKRKCS